MSKLAQLVLGALALTLVIGVGSALADGVNPPAKCGCHRVHRIHIRHVAPPVVVRERVVVIHDAPPPCDGVWQRGDEGRWECVLPVREESVALGSDFFEGSGGVGPDAIIDTGGGGGGFAEASSESFASASASASARVSIQIREHNRMMHQHMGGHSPGCGCSTGGGGHMHGKW